MSVAQPESESGNQQREVAGQGAVRWRKDKCVAERRNAGSEMKLNII